VEALERIERKEYRILVCLSSPKIVKSLTNIGVAIAKKHNAEIIFLNVIEVAEGQPLQAGAGEIAQARPLLEEAETLAMDSGIPIRSIFKVSRRISQGIIETAAEEKCNFIVLGRRKQPTFLARVFSSLMDRVLQKSPCEMAVLHGEFSSKKIQTILVPFGANIHTKLATEIAPALSEYFDAKLRVAVVMDPDVPVSEREGKANQIRQAIDENVPSATIEFIMEKDVRKAILKQSKDMDLVLMGGRTGDFLKLLLAQSLSQEITEQVKCPVLWVREYEEIESFWSSLFKRSSEVGKNA
jgi:nucleotide-binding universal stress UspA family protein